MLTESAPYSWAPPKTYRILALDLTQLLPLGGGHEAVRLVRFVAQNNVADAWMEYLIRDRLSWLRFLGFDLGAPTPDANTIRLFRERLTEAKAMTVLFDAFDNRLRTNG